MDEDWIAKRSQLLHLLNDQPRWTNAMYASTLGMSVSWVKDWKQVFRQVGAQAADKVLGRPRHRRTPFEQYAPEVIQAVLDIRDHPPDYCPRTPGPKVIQYALRQHFTDGTPRYPRSRGKGSEAAVKCSSFKGRLRG